MQTENKRTKLNKDDFLESPFSHSKSSFQSIRIQISRNTLLAILFSLLIHALFLFFLAPVIDFTPPSAPLPTKLEVSLAPPTPVKALKKNKKKKSAKNKIVKEVQPEPKVLVQKPVENKRSDFAVPKPPIKPSPTPVPVQNPEPVTNNTVAEAPTDMASYIKAQQAKRQAQEADAARQNAEALAREMAPSLAQAREERIKNNFKNGTNGIFEITSFSPRRAAFTFKGWINDYSSARRESYEVEAGAGEDIRLVMIRKMISLIREHYDGNFKWQSQRLGGLITMSARPEDSEDLEDFMMKEFFGSNYKNAVGF